MIPETTIAIRPIVILSQTFTDGVHRFETATQHDAWAVFITGPNTNGIATASNRQTAIDVATELTSIEGWKIVHIAPEGSTAEGKVPQ